MKVKMYSNVLLKNMKQLAMFALGFVTVTEGTGQATWKTPLHPSMAEERELWSTKSALKSFRFSDAFSSLFK